MTLRGGPPCSLGIMLLVLSAFMGVDRLQGGVGAKNPRFIRRLGAHCGLFQHRKLFSVQDNLLLQL